MKLRAFAEYMEKKNRAYIYCVHGMKLCIFAEYALSTIILNIFLPKTIFNIGKASKATIASCKIYILGDSHQ
jgi:hypothetical protein